MKDERGKDPGDLSRGGRVVIARRFNFGPSHFSPARGLDHDDVALAA
jgi:hypothetical protein